MLKQAFFKIALLFSLITFHSITLFGQEKYWIQLNDSYCEGENCQEGDIPTELALLLKSNLEIQLNYRSKWMPIISITLPADLKETILAFDFVEGLYPQHRLAPLKHGNSSAKEYAFALEQIKARYLTDSLKLTGKSIKIGVIDGGFMKADAEPSLKYLVNNKQIIYFKDYLLNGNTDPFYGKLFASDDHGTEVLKMIAGMDSLTNIQYGLATGAAYYLARTDHGIRENRLEEDYWVAALEHFYEMGVKLVNTSLGYTDGFDKKRENHHPKEVNGSSMITKAAQKAAEKGMLLVISAGNDGSSNWQVLSLPADAKDVLTVGSVRFDNWAKSYYSSIGPEKLAYVKPDVACFAANGTSFSAPVITGLAACIWEYDSTLSNMEVMSIIKSSSHLAENPNNYIGYGVPDGEQIMRLLQKKEIQPALQILNSRDAYYEIKIPKGLEELVLFHKKDKLNVLAQEDIKLESNQMRLVIHKKDKSVITTVAARNEILLEIYWE